MAAGDDDIAWVVTVDAVRDSVAALLELRIHPYLPAYLHLRQQAARQQTSEAVQPVWASLGELLEVPGGPPDRPHFRPFWNQASRAGQVWLGPNLAGSYSPSSIRPGQPPSRVLETNAGGTFRLRERHWELAREHLLYDSKLPILAVATFFLRDYALLAPAPPDRAALRKAFLTEFGYTRATDGQAIEQEEVDHLFDLEWSGTAEPWFESLEDYQRREEPAS